MSWFLSVTLAAGAVGYGAVWVFSSVANMFSGFSNANDAVQKAATGGVFVGSSSAVMGKAWLDKFNKSVSWFQRPATAIQNKWVLLEKSKRK